MRLRPLVFALSCLFAGLLGSRAEATPTRIVWHGHSAFEITLPSGKVLMIDPWLTNPLNPDKDPLSHVSRLDYILITHGHFDHVGDAVALAKKTGARLVGVLELGNNLVRVLGYPAAQVSNDTLGNAGGDVTIADGEVIVSMVQAIHSSGIDAQDGTPVHYGGDPVGFVLRIKNGPTIYHSGDTAFYGDMALIGLEFHPDLALINIGGHFGMEPPQAAAAAAVIQPRLVVAHHYKTIPLLTQDPRPFYHRLDLLHIAHADLSPGDSLTYEGHHRK